LKISCRGGFGADTSSPELKLGFAARFEPGVHDSAGVVPGEQLLGCSVTSASV
jgi:hypothetical protein